MNMSEIVTTGFEETGHDKTFSFKNTDGVTKLTDFAASNNYTGKLNFRQAVWVCYCTGDANSVIYLVPRGKSETAPTIDSGSAQGFIAKLAVGEDQIIHIRGNGDLYALATSSVASAIVRVIEI